MKATLGLCALLVLGCNAAPPAAGPHTSALVTNVVLKPTSDVAKSSVSGVGDTASFFKNVDDGTAFASADDSTTYVRSTASTGSHRAGYSGGPAGTVSSVTVNYRVRQVSCVGTSQVKLYAGSTLVGTGAVRNLAETWSNFTETFNGLSVADVNSLRTEVILKRTSGTGHLRYTLVWLSATVGSTDTTAPTATLTAPAAGGVVRGTVVATATASDDTAVAKVDFEVDGVVRATATSSPYTVRWNAFRETYDDRPVGKHRLAAVATDTAGNRSAPSAIDIYVMPAPAGDCNQDGVVDGADVTAIASEIGDGDGSSPEAAGGGSFLGNPACDANEDNVVDAADQTCAQAIIAQGPGACLDQNGPLVVPLVFVPTDKVGELSDGTIVAFMKLKIEETRRFYAQNDNGRTFRAKPLEVVFGQHDHSFYWSQNFEGSILQELQDRGYPTHVDWLQTPSDRVTWVMAMGGGGYAGGRHYATGSGFSMWGDAVLYAGMDRNCDRVTPVDATDNIKTTCMNTWFPGGQIYGFGVGAAVHELGHGFALPHPPDGSPDWPLTVMGYHWNYPKTGLVDANRTTLAGSHFFIGSIDPTAPTTSFAAPTAGATISGVFTIDAGAIDNYGLRAVRLLIDGVEVTPNQRYTPYQDSWDGIGVRYDWDTTTAASGSHTLTVRADDTGGHTTQSQITVTVQNGTAATFVWREAESGAPSSPLQILNDATASGGKYLQVAAGNNSQTTAPSTGRASYTFTAPAGTYRVWSRVIAPTTSDDSFWMRMDGGTWIKWNEVALGTTWHWDRLRNSDQSNTVVSFSLSAGTHTLEVAYREDGTKLDRLLVTDDPSFTPTGMGP